MGAVRPPQGDVRLEGLDLKVGWPAHMYPSSDSATIVPIPPGTDELDGSTDGGKTGHAATKPVVIGETPLRVEIVISASR